MSMVNVVYESVLANGLKQLFESKGHVPLRTCMTSSVSVHQLYRRLETIGKGAYGSVHKGEHIPSGNVVALKIINLDDKSGSDDVGDIQREVALLSQLRDAPNITKYYGCYMDGPRVWIVMEYAQGGSVLSLMKASRGGCLEERYVSVIIREVLVGLSYLHKVPVIHRDIKAANILVTATGKVVICDFGVSALLATSSSKRNTLTGTPHWMAPELLQTLPVYDTKADIWSLGIAIYEMIKGSPPHNTLENIKVMDLIPKAKPPRLPDNDASKDCRDFMAMCLRESPNERLPADELIKSKWIKTTTKVNVSLLKNLVLRFEQAAKRASLAEPLDWEEEEERDLLQIHEEEDENPWEFETVRGRSFRSGLDEDENSVSLHGGSEENIPQATIRSTPQSSTLPSSLRALFEDDSAPQQPQPVLRPPAFPISSHPGTPSPPSSFPPSASPSPGKDRTIMKRPPILDPAGDEPTIRQKTFVYPPRGMTRSRSKLSSSVPGSDDEIALFDSSLAPSPRILPSLSMEFLSDTSKKSVLSDHLSTRTPLELDTPSLPSENEDLTSDETSPSATITPGLPPSAAGSTRPLMGRRRSKSTGEALGPRRNGRADLDLASPSAFQFPPSSPSSGKALPPHSRLSPNHSNSAANNLHTAHQATFSLDTSTSTRPKPVTIHLSSSFSRTRSATTPPASEVQPPLQKSQVNETPLIPQLKSFALLDRAKNGIDNGSSPSSAAPGLKDVLKIPSLTSEHQLGMSDLLPPSPSASAYTARNFFASSSNLSSSVTNSDYLRQHSAFGDMAAAAASSFSLGNPPMRTTPPPLRRTVTEPSLLASTPTSSERGALHAREPSMDNLINSTPLHGPPIRPLDYTRLIMVDNTYTELARTIDNLTQWLTVVEVGLNGMLGKSYTDTIEEEQELGSDDDDNDNDDQVTPGLARRRRKTTLRAENT
ncbi:hypothetical protein H0H92_012132 [Tricholoma furcatifolium]|nr:hypothetical protein H0H92_012132 [Tricholoma furcatifolium]